MNVSLPVLTTEEDVQKIVDYLKTKATGATIDEAKATLGKKVLDPRKIGAYVAWGIITREGDRLKLDELGRKLSRAKPENKQIIYSQILRNIKPYRSVLDWMFHQHFDQVTNVEVAAHWHDHHQEALGTDNENTIKSKAVCFFHLCQAAGLGQLYLDRKGQTTRLEVSRDPLGQFVGEASLTPEETFSEETIEEAGEEEETVSEGEAKPPITQKAPVSKPRVFISHSKNMDIVDQIKTMLELGDIGYEIAEEEESAAIPVPEKVFSAMRNCNAAVICVTADENEKRDDGTLGINQNVLIEIGAAFVLYDKKVVLVWDKRVDVPSNLQGLYRCEFSGDELSWSAGMKLMKAVNKFKTRSVDA